MHQIHWKQWAARAAAARDSNGSDSVGDVSQDKHLPMNSHCLLGSSHLHDTCYRKLRTKLHFAGGSCFAHAPTTFSLYWEKA